MNSGKTFCQTSVDALKKRRCCHKCCENTGMHIAWICLAVQIYDNYMHTASCRITALLIASSWKFMATVEVFHKAAGVCSSSKITGSYVASFPGLPHIIAFCIHLWHFQDHQRFFRTSIEVWQKVFSNFIDSQL